MESKSIAPLLAENPIFSNMSSDHRELLAGCGRNVRFEEDTHLVREGDPAERFFVVREGRVAIEVYAPQRGAVVIQTVEEGDVVGFSALFPPYRWNFDARAVVATRAFSFDARCLREKLQADTKLGYELTTQFAQVMLKRLQATRLQLLDVFGNA